MIILDLDNPAYIIKCNKYIINCWKNLQGYERDKNVHSPDRESFSLKIYLILHNGTVKLSKFNTYRIESKWTELNRKCGKRSAERISNF